MDHYLLHKEQDDAYNESMVIDISRKEAREEQKKYDKKNEKEKLKKQEQINYHLRKTLHCRRILKTINAFHVTPIEDLLRTLLNNYIETSGEDPIMVSREDFNNIRFYLNLDIAERGINTNGIRLPTESQEYFRKMIVNIHTFIM